MSYLHSSPNTIRGKLTLKAKITRYATSLVLGSALAIHSAYPDTPITNTPSIQEETLEAEIKNLSERLDRLKQEINNLQNSDKSPKKNNKKVNNELGGFVKVNGVYSSQGYGENSIADEVFIGNKIPKENAKGNNDKLKLSARESRIWYKSSSDNSRVHLEADFTGNKPSNSESRNNNSDLRLRHAYGEIDTLYGRFLFGQTWTVLQNRQAAPNKTTYGELPGEILKRNIQFRWTTTHTWDKVKWVNRLSLENPDSLLMDKTGKIVRPDDDRIPDIMLRTQAVSRYGNLSLAAYIRELRCNIEDTCQDSKTVSGVSLSGAYIFNPEDQLRIQINHGRGIGRYAAGSAFPDASIKDDGTLKPIRVQQLMLSYSHKWSNSVYSALIYNNGQTNNFEEVDSATDSIESHSLNTVWYYTKKIRFGLEFIHANTTWTDGSKGKLNRGILSSRYSF